MAKIQRVMSVLFITFAPMRKLLYFWQAVKPSKSQTIYFIGTCFKGTPREWWELIKDSVRKLDEFVGKFKERYWNETQQQDIELKCSVV